MKKGCYGYSEDGYADMIDCIHQSWPWQRLNEDEKKIIDAIFKFSTPKEEIEYEKAWDRGSDLWESCLKLVGYQPMGWREDGRGNSISPPCDEEYILVPRKQVQALKDAISNLQTLI